MRQHEALQRVRKLHSSVKEEMPDVIVTALTVLELMSAGEGVKEEMKALTSYFEEVSDTIRGLARAEQRTAELFPTIVEFKEKIMFS